MELREITEVVNSLIEKEILFTEWAETLFEMNEVFRKDDMAVNLWERAKYYVIGIAESKMPHLAFQNKCIQIKNEGSRKSLYHDHTYSSLIIGCVMTMLAVSADKSVVEDTFRWADRQQHLFADSDIRRKTMAIIKKIYEKGIKSDYDYTKEKIVAEDGNNIDESTIEKYKQRIAELEGELESFKAESIKIEPHNKVRLELMRQLLIKIGVDFDKRGTKASAGDLSEYITGIKTSTCRGYFSDPVLNKSTHKEEITTVNQLLVAIEAGIML